MAAFASDLDLKVFPSVRWHVLVAKACQTPLWPDNVEHRWVTIHMLDSSSFTFRHRWRPQSGLRVQAIFPGSTLHSFHLFELFSILCWEVSGTCLTWGWSAQFYWAWPAPFSCLTWAQLFAWSVPFHFLLFAPGVSCLTFIGLHSSPARDGYASLHSDFFPASLLGYYTLLHNTTDTTLIRYTVLGGSTSSTLG